MYLDRNSCCKAFKLLPIAFFTLALIHIICVPKRNHLPWCISPQSQLGISHNIALSSVTVAVLLTVVFSLAVFLASELV